MLGCVMVGGFDADATNQNSSNNNCWKPGNYFQKFHNQTNLIPNTYHTICHYEKGSQNYDRRETSKEDRKTRELQKDHESYTENNVDKRSNQKSIPV